MTASLETLVVAAYVFADALTIPRRGPQGKLTDKELIALAVAQAVMGLPSDRQFLGLVDFRLPGFFPHLPDQSQFNRRCSSHSHLAGHAAYGYCASKSRFYWGVRLVLMSDA